MYPFQQNGSLKWLDHLFKGDVGGYLVDYFHQVQESFKQNVAWPSNLQT